ncbi:hypothetical protein NUU61_006163 [Penicillium alfredii]|uniref:Uncharacterized protein n=1 Tax=Penicillium alfredii TaxID=1506179 RepID=A0A9W9F0F1_9EURO|nr:uncharacterized protein NUU61_006163 [Penicillium alfredii]KAJ5091293.1 hypothetical protein NUU61_006163 [Penicillium alfredii]
MSTSSFNPENAILAYLQTLAETKKGLPHGIPVCVFASHTITDTASLLRLAAEIGPFIGVLQIQANIIDDWSNHTIEQLIYLAKRYGFLLWEGSRFLNASVNFMSRADAGWETQKFLADTVRRQYTNGPIKSATWSNLTTSWAPGVRLDQQAEDVMIPTLRKAGREAVANTIKTIQTEISVEGNEYFPDVNEIVESPSGTTDGWQEFSPTGLGVSMRKKSTISVTETVTPEPNVQPEDGVPPPPLLARGITLCLPSATDAAFRPEYRQSSVAAACAHQDFVVGFATSEPFFVNFRGNDIFEIAFLDGNGEENEEMDRAQLLNSPTIHSRHSLVLFSLVPPSLAVGFEIDPILGVDSDSESDQPYSARLLNYIVGQAVKRREANRKENDVSHLKKEQAPGPNIVQIPVIVMQ